MTNCLKNRKMKRKEICFSEAKALTYSHHTSRMILVSGVGELLFKKHTTLHLEFTSDVMMEPFITLLDLS